MARSGLILLAVGALVTTACTTVRLVQKDRCWVRRSERWLGDAKEEIGPCVPPEPKWSEDRLTRLVQECVARADYRWEARALDAWSRGEKLPEHAQEETLQHECLGEPTRAVLAENDALRKRLGELSSDRDALRTSEEDAQKRLVGNFEKMTGSYEKMAGKMADYLGSAASKAQAPATATATASSDSKGSAHTQSAHDAKTSLAAESVRGQPGTVVVTTAPGEGVSTRAAATKKAHARPPPAVHAEAPACPPPAADAEKSAQRDEAVWAPVILTQPPAEKAAGAAP